MSQPVKLSNELVLEARKVSAIAERSIAGQIEFWAKLGRSIEPLLRGDKVLALKQSGENHSMADAIIGADSEEGRRRLRDFLESEPFPHFEESPDDPDLLVQIEEDGTRTTGRFVNREFVEVDVSKKK